MTRAPVKYPGLNLSAEHGTDDAAAENLIFGFWVFLMSDAILFGMAFASYAVSLHARAGAPGPHALFDLQSAFIETVLLLISSLTYGMASLALKHQQHVKSLVVWLFITLLLGLVFLGFEVHDFETMFEHGGAPIHSGYLSAFFGLVPLHGLHVVAGSIWLICILGQLARYGVDRMVKLSIMRLALFWHFLDIIWVAIFSIVYLGGLA